MSVRDGLSGALDAPNIAMAPVIAPTARPGFLAVLKARPGRLGQDRKRKRVEKLVDKMNG